MCGIFGVTVHKDSGYSPSFIKKSLTTLAELSESRGKDSSGFVFRDELEKKLQIFKSAVPISCLLKKEEVIHQINRMLGFFHSDHRGEQRGNSFATMGHARLATNGSQANHGNNQPVVKDGVVGVHNGIIVNAKELWSRHPEIQRTYEVDTEVLLALVRRYLQDNRDIAAAVSEAIGEIFGTVSVAFLMNDLDQLVLATNNGSLYVLTNETGFFAFASEKYFLKKLAKTMNLDTRGNFRIRQITACKGCILDLEQFRLREFSFSIEAERPPMHLSRNKSYQIIVQCLSNESERPQKTLIRDFTQAVFYPKTLTEDTLLECNVERIQTLRRCSKCLLPETFPFIEYDELGICNYCKNYALKNKPKPIEELVDLVKPYRQSGDGHNCIVPFSGGRDSTYALHVVKNRLKLNPLAFTYDWGMVTDLARRNIARVCGKLGVENIVVSADISQKRENIRRNILAWLRKPHLGMIPLFMAGDKFFFYYTDLIRKQTGIRLNIWGINPMENTEFKTGFLGIPPDYRKKRIYSLSMQKQVHLFLNIGKNIVNNPRYLNGSIWDTLGSFVSRSILPHRDYFHLYDYFPWAEKEIEKLILKEYQWETAADTSTTWRIGDGTAAFYNYIYYTVAGFSEHDTFRSNQIREGMLSREEGVQLVTVENLPRYASIKWYLDRIGLDYETTIKTINLIPKLYDGDRRNTESGRAKHSERSYNMTDEMIKIDG